jgi:Na+/H+ antiporter NhaD/arsenite permease-like protein
MPLIEATATDESETSLASVDFGLLMIFVGQFILVGALVDTGLPATAFNSLLGMADCSKGTNMTEGACVYWFAAIVVVLSNLISNVPVILMLQPLLKEMQMQMQVQIHREHISANASGVHTHAHPHTHAYLYVQGISTSASGSNNSSNGTIHHLTAVAVAGDGAGAGAVANADANADADHVRYAWILVAWTATVAGNLVLVGSAANLIVAHQAFKAGDGSFTAAAHGKFGFITTLFIIFVGVFVLKSTQQ